MTRTIASVATGFALLVPVGTHAQSATYRNPVLRGDYPDPSVVRVEADYYATATSSEWAPQFPILHSRDLVNWRVIGTIFPTQPAWAEANFWAPELCRWKNKFYVYYVGRKKGGPLAVAVATADRPEGPWTDHGPLVGQEAGSIDGMAVDDEKGQRWLVWKEDGNSRKRPTPIWAQRLDDNGTLLIGEPRELLRNTEPWEGPLIEGPFIFRHGDWFYMLYAGNACCGRGCKYATGVARSKTFLGPWEKNPRNPILAENQHFRGPGHGSVVDDVQRRLWFFYHAYDAASFIYTGREMMLDEITFGEEGWPVFKSGTPSPSAPSPAGAAQKRTELSFFDDFTEAKLRPGWQWPVGLPPDTRLDAGGGVTLISSRPGNSESFGSVLARSCTSADYVATTVVNVSSFKPGTSVGLSAFGDRANALGLAITHDQAVLWRVQKGQRQELARSDAMKSSRIHIRMTASGGHLFQFSISADGKEWRDVGKSANGDYLPPWDRSIRVALIANGTDGRFGFLRLEPTANASLPNP